MEAKLLATQFNLHLPVTENAPALPDNALVRVRRERTPGVRAMVRTRRFRWYLGCKSVLDFIAALLLAVPVGPAVAVLAMVVKLTSRGPAFYTQARVGKHGRIFTIYKLRTMVDKCESLTGPRWSMPGDPRVTRVGWFLRATHLDELPQLLNVLRGDMSLIGPRPERPEFMPELERELPAYRQRLQVRPGVTGLSQVQQPADTDLASVRRKLAYDLYYIERLSPWLDLRLLVATVLYAGGIRFDTVGKMAALPAVGHVERAVQPFLGDSATVRRRLSA
jgi:lipopolysaccharide/colanic/teichoic acid biosynthesis glycosyltransferase